MALDDFFLSEFTAQIIRAFIFRPVIWYRSLPPPPTNPLTVYQEPGVMRGPCRAQCPTGYCHYLRLAKDFAFIMLRVQLITTGLNVKLTKETRHGCHSYKRILTGHDV